MRKNKYVMLAMKLVVIVVASIIYAVGISLFLDPNNLAPGGVTGISVILNRLTGAPTGKDGFCCHDDIIFHKSLCRNGGFYRRPDSRCIVWKRTHGNRDWTDFPYRCNHRWNRYYYQDHPSTLSLSENRFSVPVYGCDHCSYFRSGI